MLRLGDEWGEPHDEARRRIPQGKPRGPAAGPGVRPGDELPVEHCAPACGPRATWEATDDDIPGGNPSGCRGSAGRR